MEKFKQKEFWISALLVIGSAFGIFNPKAMLFIFIIIGIIGIGGLVYWYFKNK